MNPGYPFALKFPLKSVETYGDLRSP